MPKPKIDLPPDLIIRKDHQDYILTYTDVTGVDQAWFRSNLNRHLLEMKGSKFRLFMDLDILRDVRNEELSKIISVYLDGFKQLVDRLFRCSPTWYVTTRHSIKRGRKYTGIHIYCMDIIVLDKTAVKFHALSAQYLPADLHKWYDIQPYYSHVGITPPHVSYTDGFQTQILQGPDEPTAYLVTTNLPPSALYE